MVTSGCVSAPEPSLDHQGARRLSGPETWFWYVFAGVTYVLVAVWHKFVLNWIVGPLWLVMIVVLGPDIWDRIRGRTPRKRR